MLRNLDAEQARHGYTDAQMAEKLGVSRNTYGVKKRNGSFNRCEIVILLGLFKCKFEYLFETSEDEQTN